LELLGYEISIRRKAAVSPIGVTGGWRSFVSEPFAGAWQRNIIKTKESVLTHSAVYACVTLISSDIGKLRLKLVERDAEGIWTEVDRAAFSPVLRKPNRYQTRQKFIEQWLVSKLLYGNTYVLKERDARGIVRAMYVLDPTRVRVFVAPDGDVFYQLNSDNLTGIIQNGIQVPASEIIHDVMVPLYHPLCGVSPISACALPAAHGLKIQEHSANFFANASKPSGMLTAPGFINQETADRLKKQFEERFSGDNVGRLAVAGDGLKFESLAINATDSQLIEQLKWTAEQVCTAFHVPAYMIGVGSTPTYNNIEALNAQYYAQCLQALIEAIESLLDEGLGLSTKPETSNLGTEFDLDDLLRMDAATAADIELKLIKGIKATNESRKRFNLAPVEGGDDVRAQEQDHSLAALARRDARPDPFSPAPAPEPEPPEDEPEDDPEDDNTEERSAWAMTKALAEFREAA